MAFCSSIRATLRTQLVLVAVVLAAGPMGCGSSDDSSASGGTGGTGASGGAGGSAGQDAGANGATLAVWIGEADVAGRCDSGAVPSLAGATLAVDLPGATRLELTAGADAALSVSGIDWSRGKLALTAWAPGHALSSAVGLTEARVASLLENGVLELCLAPTTPPAAFSVTGSVQHMADLAHSYIVSSSAGSDAHLGSGVQPYAVGVRAGVPFSLIGCEFVQTLDARTLLQTTFGWTRVDHAALQAAAQVDVDFASKLPVVQVSGKLMLPAHAGSALRDDSFGYLNFTTAETGWAGAFVGLTTSSAPSAAGDAIEYQAEYANVTDLGTPVTLYSLRVYGSVQSIVWRRGVPEDGAVVDGFLDQFTTTRSAAIAPLHDPIQFASPDASEDGVVRSVFLTNASSELVWALFSWDASDPSVSFPAPPAAVDAAQVIGGLALSATPYTQGSFDLEYGFMRQVNGEAFELQP